MGVKMSDEAYTMHNHQTAANARATDYPVPPLEHSILPSPFDTPIYDDSHMNFAPPLISTGLYADHIPVGERLYQIPYQFDMTGLDTPMVSNNGNHCTEAYNLESASYDPAVTLEEINPVNNKHTPSNRATPKSVGAYDLEGLHAKTSVHGEPLKNDAWPGFACNPPLEVTAVPEMGRAYFSDLPDVLQNDQPWVAAPTSDRNFQDAHKENVMVQRFTSHARDKLLVITQNILQNEASIDPRTTETRSEQGQKCFMYIPPPEILQEFLNIYATRFEPHYELISSGALVPDTMLNSSNQESSSILLLLMIAHGASVGGSKARYLSDALTEISRIAFKDMSGAGTRNFDDIEMFRVGLATLGLTAWSGDAWHINVSLAFSIPAYTNILR